MSNGKGGFIGQDGLNAPDPATGVSASGGDTQATVSFTAPSDVGGAAITGYSVQSSNGDGTFESRYDLNGASYDNKSFSVNAQEGSPSGLYFKSDGTKVYVVGSSGDAVDQFSLSTAWDISTASFDSVTFSLASQVTTPTGIFFKPDGTSFYVQGQSVADRYVYQYNMTTAWNISTASYASKSFSTSEDNEPLGVFFKPDGTKAFVTGEQNDKVYQYGLSTAWDASTGSYDSVSFDFSATANFVHGLAFSSDGTKLFLAGYNAEYKIFSYALSTAWDLTTASYVTSFSINSQEIDNKDVQFSTDGTKMYIVGANSDTIFQYTTGELGYPTASPVTITGLTNGTSYTFNVWAINPFGWSSPSDASGSVSPSLPRGYFLGGTDGSNRTNAISYINMSTTGMDSIDFGDLALNQGNTTGCSSSTRGLIGGGLYYTGSTNSTVNTIQYITMTTSGSGQDFGDLTVARYDGGSFSNETRGVWFGGYASSTQNVIDYITIASTGNALDFGDLASATMSIQGTSGTTRGLMAGGYTSSRINVIQYVTIASTSNTTDFGNLSSTRMSVAGASSNTRALFANGFPLTNTIEYVTIASTGNVTDFGDATETAQAKAGTSSKILGFFAAGTNGAGNRIDRVTIASTGNAVDFGDLTGTQQGTVGACSTAHGGLS